VVWTQLKKRNKEIWTILALVWVRTAGSKSSVQPLEGKSLEIEWEWYCMTVTVGTRIFLKEERVFSLTLVSFLEL
jgi:hypothetical protein